MNFITGKIYRNKKTKSNSLDEVLKLFSKIPKSGDTWIIVYTYIYILGEIVNKPKLFIFQRRRNVPKDAGIIYYSRALHKFIVLWGLNSSPKQCVLNKYIEILEQFFYDHARFVVETYRVRNQNAKKKLAVEISRAKFCWTIFCSQRDIFLWLLFCSLSYLDNKSAAVNNVTLTILQDRQNSDVHDYSFYNVDYLMPDLFWHFYLFIFLFWRPFCYSDWECR